MRYGHDSRTWWWYLKSLNGMNGVDFMIGEISSTCVFSIEPPRDVDAMSDGKSDIPSAATSSSIGVWYPAHEDILIVRANGAVPSLRYQYQYRKLSAFESDNFLHFLFFKFKFQPKKVWLLFCFWVKFKSLTHILTQSIPIEFHFNLNI